MAKSEQFLRRKIFMDSEALQIIHLKAERVFW